MNEPSQVSVEIKLTSQDMVDFNFAVLNRNGALWVTFMVAIIFAVNVFVGIGQGKSFEDYQFFVYGLLFFVLIPVFTYIAAKRSFENKFAKETRTYHLSPEGIRLKTESSSSFTRWEDIQKVVKTRKAVYLFIASNAAHIFPRRFFTTDEPLKMMEQHAPEKSRKMGRIQAIRFIAVLLLIFMITVVVVQYIMSLQ